MAVANAPVSVGGKILAKATAEFKHMKSSCVSLLKIWVQKQ